MGNFQSRPSPPFLVFLDVDGVLNSAASRHARAQEPHFDAPCEKMVEILCQQIVLPTKAKVVLSSTWRLKEEKFSEIKAALAKHGVSIEGVTSNREMLSVDNQRVDEIGEYLEQYEQETGTTIQHWIAIDDLPLDRMAIESRPNALGNRLTTEHFVQTSDTEGLTEELAQEAVQKLTAI